MTVTLHSVEAASTKKRDPQKYKWYQLAKGKAKFDSAHDEFELELRKGEKFGLKFYRGSYFLVDEDDLSVQFKLSADEGKKLISASKPFSGKVAGKKVEGGKPASDSDSVDYSKMSHAQLEKLRDKLKKQWAQIGKKGETYHERKAKAGEIMGEFEKISRALRTPRLSSKDLSKDGAPTKNPRVFAKYLDEQLGTSIVSDKSRGSDYGLDGDPKKAKELVKLLQKDPNFEGKRSVKKMKERASGGKSKTSTRSSWEFKAPTEDGKGYIRVNISETKGRPDGHVTIVKVRK